MKLVIYSAIVIFGWIGWAIGARFGLMTAFILSCVGSFAGIYVGWRINRDYLN